MKKHAALALVVPLFAALYGCAHGQPVPPLAAVVHPAAVKAVPSPAPTPRKYTEKEVIGLLLFEMVGYEGSCYSGFSGIGNLVLTPSQGTADQVQFTCTVYTSADGVVTASLAKGTCNPRTGNVHVLSDKPDPYSECM